MTDSDNPLDLQLRLDRVSSLLGQEIIRARNGNNVEVAALEATNGTLRHLMSILGWRTTADDLRTRFRIAPCGMLRLKSDSPPPVLDSDVNEDEGFCTADKAYESLKKVHDMYMHNQASVVRWTDEVFLRVVCMTCRPFSGPIRRENVTVTNVEKARVPGIIIEEQPYLVSGFIDCSQLLSPKDVDEPFRMEPELRKLAVLREHPVQFLYVSAPQGDFEQDLKLKVPQAVLEMYACAMNLDKQVIRGVLTSGHQWIFLVVEINEDADGSHYYQSEPFDLVDPATYEVSKDVSIVITDIIAYWVHRSHEKIGPDDKFSVILTDVEDD